MSEKRKEKAKAVYLKALIILGQYIFCGAHTIININMLFAVGSLDAHEVLTGSYVFL